MMLVDECHCRLIVDFVRSFKKPMTADVGVAGVKSELQKCPLKAWRETGMRVFGNDKLK